MADNRNKIYARIDDVDKRKFNMETNDAYETILPYQASAADHEVRSTSSKLKKCKVCFVVIVLSILVLSVAGVCTYFAISINQLQSYNRASSYASVSALQMVNESLLNLHQQVCGKIEALNESFSRHSINFLQQINNSLLTLQQQVNNQLELENENCSHSFLQQVNNSLLSLWQQANDAFELVRANFSLHSMNVFQVNNSLLMLQQQIAIKLEQASQNLSSLQQQLSSELDQTSQNLSRLSVDLFQLQNLIQNGSFFTTSCATLPTSAPSGYYWITAPNRFPVSAYCDMTRTCGGVTGGWMRVAQLNIRDSREECPSGFAERSFNNMRYCTRPDELPGCTSLNISAKATTYSRVCGRVTAYQYGVLDTYRTYYNHGRTLTLEDTFVNGVIVTHGHPRHHVWTLIAARDELVTHNWSGCPCLRPGFAAPPPPFIGDNYFCDSGSRNHFRTDTFYGDDPLWDGAGCESVRGFANTCCTFNSPPWFYRELPEVTSDDIEMRFCRHVRNTSDLAVESFELYIQ